MLAYLQRNMKLISLAEDEEEDVVFTPWSVVHFWSGMAAHDLKIPILYWEILHLLYEGKDYFLTETNSLTNSIGDQLSTTAGYYLKPKNNNMFFAWSFIPVWMMFVLAGDRVG